MSNSSQPSEQRQVHLFPFILEKIETIFFEFDFSPISLYFSNEIIISIEQTNKQTKFKVKLRKKTTTTTATNDSKSNAITT